MDKSLTTTFKLKGTVTRRLFDTAKLNYAKEQLMKGCSQAEFERLLESASKKMFAENKLWHFFHKLFNVDLKIPFLFGSWTNQAITSNLVTTRGKRAAVEQINGVSTAPMTAIAIGTGATAAAAGDTALQTEATTNGAARGAATTSNQTTTTTGDTARWVKTFSLTGTFAITEEGIFDNNTSGGNMLARQVFSAVNVVNGDSLQITHNVQAT